MIKTLIITLFSVLLIVNISFPQAKGWIFSSINAGPSIPLGDFAKKNPTDPNSGYANIGYKVDLTVGINMLSDFSICLMGMYNSNPVDANALRNDIAAAYPLFNWNLTSESWHVKGIFMGLIKSFPVQNYNIDIKLFGGALDFDSPEYKLTGTGPGTYATVTVKEKSTYSECYIIAVGARYNINKNFSVGLNIESINSRPQFTDMRTIYDINGVQNEIRNSYKQWYNTINILATISYAFY